MAVKDEKALNAVSEISDKLVEQLNEMNTNNNVDDNAVNVIGLSLFGLSYKGETSKMNEVLSTAQDNHYKLIISSPQKLDGGTIEVLDEPSELVTFRRWNHLKHEDMKQKSAQMGSPFPDMQALLTKFLEKNKSYKKEDIFIYSTDFSSALYHKKYDYKRGLEAATSIEASDSIHIGALAKTGDS